MNSIPFDDTAEEGGSAGYFSIHRTGSTDAALPVFLDQGGVGSSPYQYILSVPGYGTIAPGSSVPMGVGISDLAITLTAVDDTMMETTQDVTISITAPLDLSYTVGTPSSAVIHIIDNDGLPPASGGGTPPQTDLSIHTGMAGHTDAIGSRQNVSDPFDDFPTTNSPPVAINDTGTVAEDGVVIFDVLANDTDPDDQHLSLDDWDGTTPNGTLRGLPGGKLEYRPNQDFYGSDTFTYTVSDGQEASTATISVTVTSVNDDVKAFNDAYAIIVPNSEPPFGWDFAATAQNGLFRNDIDWDGSAVTLSSVNSAGLQGTLQVDADGAFRYSRPPNFLGRTLFTYSIIADGQVSPPATVILDVGEIDHIGVPVDPPPPPGPHTNPDYYFFGDDPISIPASQGPLANDFGFDLVVLDSHPQPRIGRITSFNFDGSFSFEPSKKDFPANQDVPIREMGAQVGVDPSNPKRVIVTITGTFPLILIDLEISNGRNGRGLTFLEEENPGAFTVANLNDTDGDGIVDKDDGLVFPSIGPNQADPGVPEGDLMRLVIYPVNDPTNNGQKLKLTAAGPARLWTTPFKGQEVVLNNGVVEFNLADIPQSGKTLWMEATAKSGGLRDISAVLEYRGVKDTVKATAIWAESYLVRTVGNAIPDDLDEKLMRSVLAGRMAAAATWGPTAFILPKYKDGYDVEMQVNMILFGFTLFPAGVYEAARGRPAKLRVDLSRSIEVKFVLTNNGQNNINTERSFPAWLDSANDDPQSRDEDRIPTNGHIFQSDAPGIGQRLPTVGVAQNPAGPADRARHRMNAVEFVRIHLSGPEFRERAQDDPPFMWEDGVAQGTRSSEFVSWYSRIDLIKNPADPVRYQRNNVAGENEVGQGFRPIGAF